MKFSANPEGKFLDNGNFLIEKEIQFVDSKKMTWVVPANFESDGASIPRCLWSCIGGPFDDPAIRVGALFHDKGYRSGGTSRNGPPASRAEVDQMFLDAMECKGCNVIKRHLVWTGVRIGGWLYWKGK